MMKNLFSNLNAAWGRKNALGRKKSHGQSMVELALTMPVLLLIVAGTIEVTNVLTLYNTLQLATREGARLAAQGAPDATVNNVVLQSLKQTAVASDPTQLNVWVIRPKLVATGTCATCWSWKDAVPVTLPWGVEEKCISVDAAGNPACNPANSPVTANMVGAQLWRVPDTVMNDETFAIVVGRYNVQTLLNLGFWGGANASGRIPVYTYTVFRQEVSKLTAAQLSSGCSVYPIAINSAYVTAENAEGWKITAPINSFPTKRDGFGFLAWRTSNSSEADLTNDPKDGSLKTPGNSQLDVPAGNNIASGEYYKSPYTPSIIQMRRGSWVPASTVTSLSGTILGILEDHRLTKRALRVVLYNYDAPATTGERPVIPTLLNQNPGENDNALFTWPVSYKWEYQIANFAIVRVLNTQNSTTCTVVSASCPVVGEQQDPGVVQFSFVKMDSSCGFAQ